MSIRRLINLMRSEEFLHGAGSTVISGWADELEKVCTPKKELLLVERFNGMTVEGALIYLDDNREFFKMTPSLSGLSDIETAFVFDAPKYLYADIPDVYINKNNSVFLSLRLAEARLAGLHIPPFELDTIRAIIIDALESK